MASQLPKQLPLERMQSIWKSQLDPILANNIINGSQLTNISLISGVTVINHLLSRKQQGWFITDIDGAAQVYRSQPFNDKTLTLTSDAPVIVNIWCY